MNDFTPATAPLTSAPTGSSSPPTDVAAPPGTALEIAQRLKAGSLDTKQAGRLAKAGNLSTLHVAQALQALHTADEPQDQRSPEERQVEAHYGPVGVAEKYRVEMYPPGDPTPLTPQDKAVVSVATRALVAMGFPQSNGQALLNTVARLVRSRAGWTPAQRAAARDDADQKIEVLYGNTYDARLPPTKAMLDEAEQHVPGLKAFLWDNGIIGHPEVINALVTQARVYHARKGR